jgi:membrane protease YdiL (CAAX protease family)
MSIAFTPSRSVGISTPFHTQTVMAKGRPQSTATSQWKSLIPVIATIACALLFSPIFAIGFKIGLLCASILVIPIVAIVGCGKEKKSDKDSNLIGSIFNTYHTCILAPAYEELIFRGGIQTGVKLIAERLLPAMTVPLLMGPPVAVASLVAVVATSILFGLGHLVLRGSTFNAVYSGMTSLIDGALKVNHGLAASIGSHMANNTMVSIGLMALDHI